MTTITLTFDNGPDPEVTPLVLDTLRRRDILSTFFVLGDKLRDRRALAERAHGEGHWIGNHTFNHIVPLGLAAEAGVAAAEIARTQDLIGDLAHPRRFFRPFGNGGLLDRRLLNEEALEQLRIGCYTCVLWNVIAHDWALPEGWVERALEMCFRQETALIVLHDLPTEAMRRLDHFIGAARDRGATFVQDFPAACVPIERGSLVGSLDPYVTLPDDTRCRGSNKLPHVQSPDREGEGAP
jgi:peptidoglycan-N-acetylglucosamine deacetylase